jgi:protein-S-isoprenylcysteine O-methyltransferase Ste14
VNDRHLATLMKPADLDRLEKISLILVFSVFAFQIANSVLENRQWVQLIYLFDQFVILTLLLLRRPATNITPRPGDWALGYVGTLIPLLLGPISPDAALAPPAFSATLILLGMIIHLSAKASLRRSFGGVPANRGIKTGGAYRYVRHPMYLGYILVQLGYLLAGPNPRNFVLVIVCWILSFLRINAEERLLIDDPSYRAFMERTPYRVVPGIY